jgi:hypothetical protein
MREETSVAIDFLKAVFGADERMILAELRHPGTDAIAVLRDVLGDGLPGRLEDALDPVFTFEGLQVMHLACQ